MSTSRGRSRVDDQPVAGARRRGRERALGLLYEAETKGQSPREILGQLPAPPEYYAVALFEGVVEHGAEIDRLIGDQAHSWSVDRMPVVDRQLLRLATFEMIYRPDVPCAVIIDEAIELAKNYSTDESGKFVNGVLAGLARQLRPDDISPAPDVAEPDVVDPELGWEPDGTLNEQ